MNTVAIDTYKTINKLKAKGFSTEQAEGIIDTITEYDYVTNGTLKSMLTDVTHELKLEMKNQRVELMKWVTGVLIAQSAAIVALQSLIN